MASLARLSAPCLALLVSGCSGVWLPEFLENRVGAQVTRAVLLEMPHEGHEAWRGRIETIGRRIAAVSERPHYHYQYYVVESSTANAFAIPDGSIFVTTGLLKLIGPDELALAGVLAHETGHIARRHGAETLQSQLGWGAIGILFFGFGDSVGKQAGQIGAQIVGLGYGREMELEADVCAVRYLVRLGYKPDVTLKFLKALLPLETGRDGSLERYLRSHPPTRERIRYVEDYIGRYLSKPR